MFSNMCSRRFSLGNFASRSRKHYPRSLRSLLALLVLSACTTMPRVPDARMDHIILGAADLDRATRAFERITGVRPVYGGKHPTGTHNALVSLGGQTYLEIIAAQPGAGSPDWLPNLTGLQDLTPAGWAVTADDGTARRRELVAEGFALTDNTPGARTTPSGARILRTRRQHHRPDAGSSGSRSN